MTFLRGAWFALFITFLLHEAASVSDPVEVAALQSIKSNIGDGFNRLNNWVGDDPCGTSWTGIYCVEPIKNGTQFVSEIRLLNMNLTGTLAPDFGNLTQLTILDVMWNNITGSIPPEFGNLENLFLLLLNGNKLSGTLPSELGNLSNLNRIQIDQNNISGPVPVTFQYLNKAKHFHMNNNSLNGTIPKELGRLETLFHLLLDNNNLSGELPSELSNISTLLILQLDNNHFNGSIPSNYSQMPQLLKMSLRNCNLSGAIPNISSLTSLSYLDLSNNQLTGNLASGNVPKNLTYIDLSFNQLNGELPSDYLEVPNLEFLILRNNSLDGTIQANVISGNQFTNPEAVLVLDLQDNNFSAINFGLTRNVQNITIWLYGNPYCSGDNSSITQCQDHTGGATNISISNPSIQIRSDCTAGTCDGSLNQELNFGLLELGQCQCASPLTVGYRLKSPGFAFFPPYETGFGDYLSSGISLFDYQVNISSYNWEPGPRLGMTIKLFPTNDTHEFNTTEVDRLYTIFATWNISDNNTFGPYEVLYFDREFPYNGSTTTEARKGLSGGEIAGIVIGAAAVTAIVVAAAMFFIVRHRLRYIGPSRLVRKHERIKVAGVKDFTYEEMAKATNNFDSSMQIGQGGYGKVYRAVLGDGTKGAIKRAEVGSLQGSREFYTEIELLSRVHHRNLVGLLGYCDDEGEQMLVYEFMYGNLRDYLDSHSKRPLDFPTRLQIALGSAKGILYLHTEANPPIYHRDIKASNILLDEKRRAKVSDFGLSKLAPVSELEGTAGGHVSTVVKGTPGYLDPEYFLTHKLTDKSDVYSFGVVLLELVTGMQPISHGKNLVREVNLAYEAGVLLSMVDPRMGSYPAECLEPLVRLAVSCCKDDTDARPSMAEIVRELETIWRTTPWSDSVVSFETSVDTEASNLKDPRVLNNPYISSDIDGSGLMSGTIPNVAPR